MIGRLHGVVVAESVDGSVTVDVQGVGYEVQIPQGSLGRCARSPDGAVTLSVHTHVREDVFLLYGFASEADRAAFRLLLAVSGVGPKIAVGIVGALPAGELALVLARGDTRRLQGVPGVGKRIAERLVLELKDKIAAGVLGNTTSGATPGGPAVTPTTTPSGPTAALVTALGNLGFRPAEVERVAAELAPRAGEPVEVLVREALKKLVP